MVEQLNIDFKPSVYAQYSSLREFIAEHVIPSICTERGVMRKSIAMDLDYAPSHFSQKVYGTGSSRLTVDDMEQIIDLYGTDEVLKYLAYKQARKQPKEALEAQIAELQKQLEAQP